MAGATPEKERPATASEREYLEGYRPEDFARPSVTVDLVIFTVIDTDLKVLLVRRGEHPFRDCGALPGGFVRVGETSHDRGESLEEAAHRVLEAETGLPRGSVFLEQLYTFGDPRRDPRLRVISVAYYALVRPDLSSQVTTGTRSRAPGWFSVAELDTAGTDTPGPLAFDHDRIIAAAVDRIRGKIDYMPLAFELVPPTFTIAELRQVYEAIKGETYDAANFRRRFRRMQSDGLIEEAPGKRQTSTKPAKVYRFRRH